MAMRGLTVFFTGLSGAGKTTVATTVRDLLREEHGVPVSYLDGDEVRTFLSSELGFSKEHRDLNVLRIAWVAREVTRHGGVAVCAPIAPYRETRRKARAMIEPLGRFVEVHVSTPLEVCEARDPKGLYAEARAGRIERFTGISDPYEAPEQPELRIDTSEGSAQDAARSILAWLRDEDALPGR